MMDKDITLSIALLVFSYAAALGISLAGFQSWPPMVVAVAATLNYMHNRFELCKTRKVTEQDDRIGVLEQRLNILVAQLTALHESYADVRKQSEDVKKMVTQYNLKQAFGPKV